MKLGIAILVVITLGKESKSKNYFSEASDNSVEVNNESDSAQTSCPCGWTNKARVVGGKATEKNEFPLMVGVVHVSSESVFCGGSIITKFHVLTAAHCTQPLKGDELQIVAGAHDLFEGGKYDTIVDVKETIEHEEYSPKTHQNDIALLVMAEAIEFNQYIGPVCMPSSPYNLLNRFVKLIGWGKTSTKGEKSDVLLKVNLKVVPLKTCENSYGDYIDLDKPKQICTFRKGKDSCQGDSGGPLLWLDEATNRYTQVGLVSYGRECASSDPAVNTDVFAYIDWINKKIEESNMGGTLCHKI